MRQVARNTAWGWVWVNVHFWVLSPVAGSGIKGNCVTQWVVSSGGLRDNWEIGWKFNSQPKTLIQKWRQSTSSGVNISLLLTVYYCPREFLRLIYNTFPFRETGSRINCGVWHHWNVLSLWHPPRLHISYFVGCYFSDPIDSAVTAASACALHISLYIPLFASNCWCVPLSLTSPRESTNIWSALAIVLLNSHNKKSRHKINKHA